jgi:HEAT repeat protein
MMASFLILTCSCCTLASQSKKIDDLVGSVKSGDYGAATVDQLARLGAVRAVPLLKAQFNAQADPILKDAIASALVRLGVRDETYWRYVMDQARPALESDAPFAWAFDSEGKLIKNRVPDDLVAWAKLHSVSVEEVRRAQIYDLPGRITLLAVTGDLRGLSPLRRGLQSPNYYIEAQAARGLAKLRDSDSVPLIIIACKKAPAEFAPLIARALVYFNDAQAQQAAKQFVPSAILEDLRRRIRQHGSDPFGD